MNSSNFKKSDSIVPEIRLAELIDVDNLRSMMESFHQLTGIPMSLADCNGKLIAGAGWLEICSTLNGEGRQADENCVSCGLKFAEDINEGEFRHYRCSNGLWDMVAPLFFGKYRIGYLFSGQFFFSNEVPDREFFVQHAIEHNFNVEEYLEIIDKVPRVDRAYFEKSEAFFIRLADGLAKLGYNRMKLEKALADTHILLASVKQNKYLLEEAQSIAHLGSWELDLRTNRLTWSDEVYRIFGLAPLELDPTYEGFLAAIHPDDLDAVAEAYTSSIESGSETYEIEHRIIRKNTGEIRWVHEKCRHFRDISGEVVKSVGMVHDITDRKKAEFQLMESRNNLFSARNHFRRSITRVRKQPYLCRGRNQLSNTRKLYGRTST